MTEPITSRRTKFYRIDPQCILDYLRRFDQWPVAIAVADVKGPPEGAEILSVDWCLLRRCFMALVCHPDFPEVSDGEEIPFAHDPLITHITLMTRGEDGAYRLNDMGRHQH